MRITLGVSEHVKPLFDIKYEKKDEIFSDVYYYLRYETCTNSKDERTTDKRIAGIYILTPESELPWYAFIKKHTRKDEEAKLKKSQREGLISEEKVLLSDLPYRFSTEYFRYIDGKTWGKSGIKAPYMLDIRNAGALGIVSPDNSFAHDTIKHIVLELAYYHSPEDIQFVFFFEEGLSIEEQKQRIDIYKFLPHCNELLENTSQFVFDKESAGLVYGQLLNIMTQRAKDIQSDEENEVESEHNTQIVCVVFEDYNIKSTGFQNIFPKLPKRVKTTRINSV